MITIAICIYELGTQIHGVIGVLHPPPFSITYIYILDQICLFQVIKQPILYVCVCGAKITLNRYGKRTFKMGAAT